MQNPNPRVSFSNGVMSVQSQQQPQPQQQPQQQPIAQPYDSNLQTPAEQWQNDEESKQ